MRSNSRIRCGLPQYGCCAKVRKRRGRGGREGGRRGRVNGGVLSGGILLRHGFKRRNAYHNRHTHSFTLPSLLLPHTGTPPPSLDTTPLTPQNLPSFLLSAFPALTPSLRETTRRRRRGYHAPSSSFWLEVEGVVLKEGEGEEGEEGEGRREEEGDAIVMNVGRKGGKGGREGGREGGKEVGWIEGRRKGAS